MLLCGCMPAALPATRELPGACAPGRPPEPPSRMPCPTHPAPAPARDPYPRNFIYSLVAGAAVLGLIAGAITAVSNFDPVKRG
jgi:hypothetical protein